jgi:hypothetical protein
MFVKVIIKKRLFYVISLNFGYYAYVFCVEMHSVSLYTAVVTAVHE